MKKTIIFLMILVAVKIQAQQYQISFAGSGASTTIDSVKVQDLTQCTGILLNGGDVLNLNVTAGVNEISNSMDNTLHIYPNPMTGYCQIEFEATGEGEANIELYDIAGKRITQVQEILTKGEHKYSLSGVGGGIYVLKVESSSYSYSAKVVSTANNGTQMTQINMMNADSKTQGSPSTSSGTTGVAKSLKGNKSLKDMQYKKGDTLMLTGISGIYRTVYMLVPKTTQTVTFNFIACTDKDNNNYAVVQIRTQTWMGENLKTTTYNDGSAIPLVTDNTAWTELSTAGYCWYNDSIKYKNIYGALYNWYAVKTGILCPSGWHVPDTTEWNTLINYLGGWEIAGSKMKAACSNYWYPYQGVTNTNSSGFSALPGGSRYGSHGNFYDVGISGYWWSATEYDATDAWDVNLICDYPSAGEIYDDEDGFSVRCLRD